MNCSQLAARIQELDPTASGRDVARLCLLLMNDEEHQDLAAREDLCTAWKETGLKLQLATDQHAAMTQELEELAQSDPHDFNRDQIWVLVRAIKVQSQILKLYLGEAVLDV